MKVRGRRQAGGAAKAPCGKSEAVQGKCPAGENKPAGAKVRQVGPGQFEIDITELKPGEKREKGPVIVLSERKAESPRYWVGLSVEPDAQGLVVERVAPGSPAAKAGIKPGDVMVRAGGKPLKKVADLIAAVQKAKETDLALEVLHGGKTQKITVKPAKRPAEGKEGVSREELQKARKRLQETLHQTQKAARTRMRERVKRRHELADEAWQIYQKMESLGDGKKGEAHELWEKLEGIEGELRRTFEPAPLPGAGGSLRS